MLFPLIQTGNFLITVLSSLFSLAIYLLTAFSIYQLARIRSLPNAWYAFIPFLSLFMTGMIGDSLKYDNYKINNLLGNVPLMYVLPILSVISSIIGWPIGGLASLLMTIGTIVVYYMIFNHYAPNSKILFTILCCIPGLGMILGALLILYSIKDYRTNY